MATDPDPTTRAGATRHLLHLDYLRGIAALCVVIGHRRPWFGDEIMPHYFLAVDFFFILSGFVIDRAYRHKIGTRLTARDFIVLRMIRLYPLIVVGVALGAIVELARVRVAGGDLAAVIWTAGANALLIPYGSDRWPYPINDPMWSLFFELAANLAFLFLAPLLTRRWLVAITAAMGVAFVWIGFASGTVAHGSRLDIFAGGFLRVGFGFFAGCLLNRLYDDNLWRQVKLGAWTPLILVAIFMMPRTDSGPWFELLCIVFVFPLLVLAGARAQSIWPRLEAVSGELSYPLYILHIPLLFLLGGALRATGLSDGTPSALEGALRILMVCVTAWVVYVAFDKPVRGWLSRQLIRREKRGADVTP